ncbi:universal stress protein [Pedobacter sp. L105]|uniref:universal stress protein n=1 Tax=Pedobacter sp. L105 TaxID=1641871 RepID=UPI00131E58E5|nr:universal stress protein [Pedobacter sp. L105]
MKNILLATDFSVNSTYAADFGYHLAKQLDANIVLCNAIIVPAEVPQSDLVAWSAEGEDILQNYSDMELTNLQTKLQQIGQAEGFNPVIKSVCCSGTVESVLENTVESHQIDLIVMGTHQSGSLRDFLLNNHSQQLITKTKVPLLLVPPATPKSSIHRIAFATDLQQINIDLDHIYALIAIAKPINADIVITYVGEHKDLSPLAVQRNEELLTQISNKADYAHIFYKYLNNSSVEAGLEWVCVHDHIDVLAMVPRRHNLIESLMNGSHTQKMAKRLAIPLLVFPPK